MLEKRTMILFIRTTQDMKYLWTNGTIWFRQIYHLASSMLFIVDYTKTRVATPLGNIDLGQLWLFAFVHSGISLILMTCPCIFPNLFLELNRRDSLFIAVTQWFPQCEIINCFTKQSRIFLIHLFVWMIQRSNDAP